MEIGFKELTEKFMDCRVFKYKSANAIIKATHLTVIPSMRYGPGFSIEAKFRDLWTMQFEPSYIPEKANSFEQGLAFIVYGIGYGNKRWFPVEDSWYVLGESYKEYLPWEIERKKRQEEYDKLDKVYFDITWMRVLVKLLKEWRDDIKQNEEISITFNGEFAIFKCGGLSIPIPGKGKKWDKVYYVEFIQLDNIPVRIFNHGSQFIINGDKLTFGNKVLIISREVLKDKHA